MPSSAASATTSVATRLPTSYKLVASKLHTQLQTELQAQLVAQLRAQALATCYTLLAASHMPTSYMLDATSLRQAWVHGRLGALSSLRATRHMLLACRLVASSYERLARLALKQLRAARSGAGSLLVAH